MTIVVTGGTKGIGLAIAARLARQGEPMVLAYHRDEAAAEVAKTRIAATGAKAVAIRADVGSIDDCASLMAQVPALEGEGTLHLVHSAAMIYPTTLLGADLETFTQAVQTNGLSLLYLVQKALPLLERGAAAVVFYFQRRRAAPSPTPMALWAPARRWPKA